MGYNEGNTAYRALDGMRWMPVDFMEEENKGRDEAHPSNKVKDRQPNKPSNEKEEDDLKNTYKNPFG